LVPDNVAIDINHDGIYTSYFANFLENYYKLIETKYGLDRKMFYKVEYAEKEKEAIKKFKKLFRKEKFSYKNYRRF